ncbi:MULTISPECIES: nuclear transport factor 2 family protein [unclassified Nocardia]|uniref:nuclear transport factor 2 family protein n=1 Tax=unclassified Nocardia TaxID=2637762 RepID=UPI001CE42743|nr:MULTISPECIES: nuclear transport factor 2 family protein [unclassified Nocardia]
MALSVADRLDIAEVVALQGHLTDDGAFDRMDEVFAPEIVYDVRAFGLGELHGREALREAALALGDRNPVGHHVTNIVVREDADGTVRVRSKGIGINADGSCGSAVYDDIVIRTPDGWRISHRTIRRRETPLTP